MSLNWRDKEPVNLSMAEVMANRGAGGADHHAESFKAGFNHGASMKKMGVSGHVHEHGANPFHPTKEASHHHAWKAGLETHAKTAG